MTNWMSTRRVDVSPDNFLYYGLHPDRRMYGNLAYWERRLAERIEFYSVRNRLRRRRATLVKQYREMRYRISLAHDVLRGKHDCEDYW